MKRILLLMAFVLAFSTINAQSKRNTTFTDSMLDSISKQWDDIHFRVQRLDRYKLYKTDNIYTLLKLDTRTGKIQQLQWSLSVDSYEGSIWINKDDLSLETGNGTFELYPTGNMYQFILLDKVTGNTWHVQWGMDDEKRWIHPLY